MKNFTNKKKYLIVACILGLLSCEEPETIVLPTEQDQAVSAADSEKNQGQGRWSIPVYKTSWEYEVIVATHDIYKAGSDGRAKIVVKFNTDVGEKTHTVRLGDYEEYRHRNTTDTYTFTARFTEDEEVLKFIQIKEATLMMQGENGWKVKSLNVRGTGDYQSQLDHSNSRLTLDYISPSDGNLDSNCTYCWDSFETGNIGTGTYIF